MEKQPTPPRRSTPLRRGLFALTLSAGVAAGAVETINVTSGHAAADTPFAPGGHFNLGYAIPRPTAPEESISQEKTAIVRARRAYTQALAQLAAREASTTTTTTTTSLPPTTTIPPTTSTTSGNTYIHYGGSDATDAFTADWYRCVINPESSGNFNDTSGGYGILVSTWHEYGMAGVPGEYSPAVQAQVALRIYAANGGFGPNAWNNGAHCGKNG